jgi:sugar/nucleoside kinase (ribokinase family)
VTVGHVTVDVLSDDDDRRRPGGGTFYSALQGARLGLRTLIITRGVPRELEELLEPYRSELDVQILPAERTTTLHTWYESPTHPAARRQRLLAWAGPIDGPVAVDTSILHLAPVARETPRSWQGRADFVGLTPQGLVREWDARGDIAPAALHRELLPERWDAAVFSATELASCKELLPSELTRSSGPLVAVTAGAQPVTLHLAGGALLDVTVAPIEGPHDDLGAGDVFAAAFFVALRDGLPPVEAAAFANAAAAVRIAGTGPGAIGDSALVEARLQAAVTTRGAQQAPRR